MEEFENKILELGSENVAAFIAEQGVNPGAALKEIMRSLTQSIVSSTGAATPQLVVPPPPDGTIAIELDEL